MEAHHLCVDSLPTLTHQCAVVHPDKHRQRQHLFRASHAEDDVNQELLERARHPSSAEVAEQVEQQVQGVRAIDEEATHEEWPEVGMVWQHREGGVNVRHTHEVVLAQEPCHFVVRVQRVAEEAQVSGSIEARAGVIRGRPVLTRRIQSIFLHSPNGAYRSRGERGTERVG